MRTSQPTNKILLAGCLALAASICVSFAAAQNAATTSPSVGQTSQSSDPRNFDGSQFGQRVSLGPNWLFAAGDNPAYASPTFDDSGWKAISTNKELIDYGIRNIHYGWYRIHVHLRPGATNLAIGVERIYGAYEVYANGVRVGSNGDIAGMVRFSQRALFTFPVPDSLLSSQKNLVIAIRFSLGTSGVRGPGTSTPLQTWSTISPAGIYLLSRDEAPRDVSYANAHNTYDDLLLGGLALLASLVALALCLALRSQREYLAVTV